MRIALLTGTLGRGGAEKQLVYMAVALRDAGVDVRVYTFRAGEFYEAALKDAGLTPIVLGRNSHPLARLAAFTSALRGFRPDIAQATHFYENLYVAIAARLSNAVAIGAIRTDLVLDLRGAGRWGPLLLRAPQVLVANSDAARRAAIQRGIPRQRLHVVPNVIDASTFVGRRAMPNGHDGTVVALIGQLIRAKRVDRFLDALAIARQSHPSLRGIVVGAGPERAALENHARRLGLSESGVSFPGASDDVPGVLARADMLALTSDSEGFPNVILEAMASHLPVVTTPAGDAALVVQHQVTGYVVPSEDTASFAAHLVRLTEQPGLRRALGAAGYARAQQQYAVAGLADRLLEVYRAAGAGGAVVRELSSVQTR